MGEGGGVGSLNPLGQDVGQKHPGRTRVKTCVGRIKFTK